MKLICLATSAAVLAALSATASAEEALDEFRIDVVLEDLETSEGSEEFDRRLQRAARRYCQDNYLGSDRRALRSCEEAVVAAVYDALEDDNPVRIASSDTR